MESLNARAGQLFEAGDASGYMSLMSELARKGLVSRVELSEHEHAIRQRAQEVALLGHSGTSSNSNSSGTVTKAQREALASALSQPPSQQPAAVTDVGYALGVAAGDAELAKARALWDAARPSAAFASQLWSAAQASTSTPQLQGTAAAAPAAPAPAGFEEARALWGQYLEAAGEGVGLVGGWVRVVS